VERHTRSYVQLIKPGITLSNTITAVAGFFLAVSVTHQFSFWTFFGATAGVAFVIASACVANNILDRDIDKHMKRTAARDVARGTISVAYALIFSVLLGLVGFGLLLTLTTVLAFWLGVIAYIWYVAVYGIAKRTTAYSTIIGGVAGSLPPMAGYVAVTGSIDMAAIIVFLILFFWQLPHFYAIAMFRRDDYAKAKLPVWSVRYGMASTKLQIFVSAVLYAAVSALLPLYGYVGVVYSVGAIILAAYWIYKGIALYNKGDDIKWAKTMFGISLLVLMAISGLIAIGGFLP